MRALVLLLLFSLPALADERYVELPDGLEVPVDQYAGQGSGLLLWLPSEYGIQAQHRRVAAQLAKAGTDVWLADLFAGHFLPDVASSVDAIPAGEVVGLIEAALSGTADKVYLFGHDRGARLALSGAREWQLTHPGDERLAGLILISPSLYADVSEVGKDAEYLSIVSATNLPVYLVQSEFSGFRWRLNGLRKELEKGGSDVFVRLLPGVHDAYFSLADIGPQERQALERLPELLHNAVRLLGSLGGGPRYAAALQGEVVSVVAARDDRLKPYKGDPRPPPLRLKDLGGEQYALSSLRGNVVLVNFWATWCPPCVEEIPSLQSLYEQLADRSFEILAVSVGETADRVETFLDKRPVQFPVLLDSEGQTVKPWKVYAYPTNMLVDKQGSIRYAFFGAVDWQRSDIIAVIRSLLDESRSPQTLFDQDTSGG